MSFVSAGQTAHAQFQFADFTAEINPEFSSISRNNSIISSEFMPRDSLMPSADEFRIAGPSKSVRRMSYKLKREGSSLLPVGRSEKTRLGEKVWEGREQYESR